MFCLSKPSESLIREFISAQRNQPFSYPDVGTSSESEPEGYTVDGSRVRLGTGVDVFERAKNALRHWKMFDLQWITLCWPDTPIEKGATVALLISHLGFWSMNACRIVYVVEDHGTTERYGFAYGTLPDHGEFGEERFTVEYNIDDGAVSYDIFAFSRPGFLARLGYPFSRALQKRFSRESMAAMQKAAAGES